MLHPNSTPDFKSSNFELSAYDYILPDERIAQDPVVPRDRSKLLLVGADRQYSHQYFYQLPGFLRSGDLLILNNTKVISARLYGKNLTGAKVEVLLLEPVSGDRWLALVMPGKKLPVGSTVFFEPEIEGGLRAEVIAINEAVRGRELQFFVPKGESLNQAIERLGVMPLPPYITSSTAAPDQYQTVYAKQPGAIAAPTAGLHFTQELLQSLKTQGIDQTFVTLHVGMGTFRPVQVEDIRTHVMHQEWIEVTAETITKIAATKARGGRVIGVGTTAARAIESSGYQPFCGKTDLMIYPGYQWQVLDGLITNFHLPKSSLLMLVASFLGDQGREFMLELYQEAIAQEYRFYSFGDAMLLWRDR